MTNHFIHYLPCKIYFRNPKSLNDLWLGEFQSPEDGFDKTKCPITNSQTGVFKEIQNGGTIWIISLLHSPWGIFRPALDAKIGVCKMSKDENGRTKFDAAYTSSWFPLSDTYSFISKLQSVTSSGKRNLSISDSTKPIGFYLQNISKLFRADELINWTNYLEKKILILLEIGLKMAQ